MFPKNKGTSLKSTPARIVIPVNIAVTTGAGYALVRKTQNAKKIPIRKQNDMTKKAFQEYYADEFATCYGCGRLNQYGLQIKSYWDGEESVCRFRPKPYHTGGFPGYVYGGLIASLIDCHGAGTASAAKSRYDGKDMETYPPLRFVTAALHVDYLAPTPIDEILELRGSVKEIKGRKIIVAVTLSANNRVCAKGEVTTVQMPEDFPHT